MNLNLNFNGLRSQLIRYAYNTLVQRAHLRSGRQDIVLHRSMGPGRWLAVRMRLTPLLTAPLRDADEQL